MLLLTATIITLLTNHVFDLSIKSIESAPAVAIMPMQTPAPVAVTSDVATTTTATTDNPNTTTDNTPPAPTLNWQILLVKSGDTLAKIFHRNHLSAKDMAVISKLAGAKTLHRLTPGQELRLYKNASGALQQMVYATNDKTTLTVTRTTSGFTATTQSTPIANIPLSAPTVATNHEIAEPTSTTTTQKKAATPPTTAAANSKPTAANTEPTLNYVSGRIKRSLTADARKAGLSAKQVSQLTQMFSEKNLAQSMRPGDQFSVLYENPKVIKQKKYSGNVVAAQLTHHDKVYQLIRFTDPKGGVNYYTPQGQSLKDGLLREPLRFTYISSGFSSNRLDPVLHYRRPHLGVDYAAPTGTPVKAAGDGVVVETGYKGGYGKTIVLKHDDKYTTLYGHLSKYASNLREGQTVQQGQIIGYVGQTGFATGPHLHYEIHMNDVPYNPLTVALPGAPIPKAYRNQFFAQSKVLLAQLNTKHKVQLAQKDQPVKRS